MAKRSRGTPRLANRLLKRVRDFAQVKYDGRITYDVAVFALDLLEVDQYGLDKIDRRILKTLIERGFIEKVEDNKYSWKVNVYRFSSAWKHQNTVNT